MQVCNEVRGGFVWKDDNVYTFSLGKRTENIYSLWPMEKSEPMDVFEFARYLREAEQLRAGNSIV